VGGLMRRRLVSTFPPVISFGRLFSSLVPFVASLIPVVAQSGDLLLSECPHAVSLPAEILRTKMRLLAAL
jgi:hypothetical protein